MFPIRDLNPTRGTAYITIAITLANVLVYVLWQPHGGQLAQLDFLYHYAAVACELVTRQPIDVGELTAQHCLPQSLGTPVFPDKNLPLSVLVSMFLHSGLLHIAGNMWFLWIFGDNVEEAFGAVGYALLYLVAGIAAAAGFTLVHADSVQPLIGASGAIAGVLGAYLVLFPTRPVLALWVFGLIPVPSLIFLGLWFVGQFSTGDAGVAWEAHVAGFVAGALIALAFRGPLLRRSRGGAAARAGAW